MSKKLFSLLTLICVLSLALPQMADAKAGGGRSTGSRGGRTYQALPPSPSYQAQPIQRSARPMEQPAAPRYQPQNPTPMGAPAPSFFSNHPFLSSLAGGFLGAGLFNSLFGGGMNAGMGGYGANSMGGGFGSLFQIIIIGGLIFLVYRWFRRSRSQSSNDATYSPFNLLQQSNVLSEGAPLLWGNRAGAANAQPDAPYAIAASDMQEFQNLLVKIQTAWSHADMNVLRSCLTPEMLGYFNEELSANISHGLANKVEQVTLLAAEPVESWAEAGMTYATMHMKWSAIDAMTRLDKNPADADYVAEGSLTVPTENQEIWTFARAENGGRWLLSAIQQIS